MNAPELLSIPLERVLIPGDRLREVNADRVAMMAISMAEQGQITPIEVIAPDAEGRYAVNAGAHRVSAARAAGLTNILAVVFDGDATLRRLREIDENLYRAELSPFDQAVFLAERRRLYETLNGAVRRGRPKKGIAPRSGQLSFFDDTTAKFGITRKVVQNALTRYFALEDLLPDLRRLKMDVSGAQLDALARLQPGERRRVIDQLQSGAPTMASALASVRPAKEAVSALEKAKEAFRGLTPAERGHFLAWAASAAATR